MLPILQQFEVATRDMSSNDNSVSKIIPFVMSMQKYLKFASENVSAIKTVVRELKENFQERFRAYRNNDNLKLAKCLDPRFKLD